MSSFGKSSSSSGSTGNLFRSQSLASLGGEKMVLGEGFRSSYTLRAHKAAALKELGLNSKSISKIAKAPRPKRTDDIFKAVITGLRFVFLYINSDTIIHHPFFMACGDSSNAFTSVISQLCYSVSCDL